MTAAVLVTADPQDIGRKSPAQIETEVSRHLQALTDFLGTEDYPAVAAWMDRVDAASSA